MYKDNQDTSSNEVDILKNHFEKIGKNINTNINRRIVNYNNSILYKYYANVFYFVPKHGLIKIDGGNHRGYLITPDHPFFIKDKKKDNTLKFTPKINTVIVPIDNISTEQNSRYLEITIDLKNDFEFDNLTIWIDPEFVKNNTMQAHSILKKILGSSKSSMLAEIYYNDKTKAVKEIVVSKLNFQIKSIETDIVNIHTPSLSSGFNVNIKNLFAYGNKEINKIKIFLEADIKKDITVDLQSLLKVNLVPVFNSYNDYSYTIFADLHLSEVNLRHIQNTYASPMSVLSIYENNNKVELDGFFFKGQNEYYFNCKSRTLNYNTILPRLTSEIEDTRVYAYALWTDAIDLSDFIKVSSNDISSIKCSITHLEMYDEITNYKMPLDAIFRLAERLHSKDILSKSLIDNILTILQFDKDTIQLILNQIEKIQLSKVDNRLHVTLTPRFSKRQKPLLNFMIGIICGFINRNSSIYIKNFIFN